MPGLCEEEVHLFVLKHSPEGLTSSLTHIWGPGGAHGDWQPLSLCSPFALLQPLGAIFCL